MAKKTELTDKVDDVVNGLFGDRGPFGWNDPHEFQMIFDKASKANKLIFIEAFLAKTKVRLLEKI